MQIKKINNNKLKVILNSDDLYEKNIDVDSFLSNSIESQDLFFEILDVAEDEYGFDIENNKAVVETVSLDNNIFILTITKFKNDIMTNSITPFKIYRFEKIEDIFNIYSYLKKYISNTNNISIYEFLDNFYLLLEECNEHVENMLLEYSTPFKSSNYLKDILIEYGNILNQ